MGEAPPDRKWHAPLPDDEPLASSAGCRATICAPRGRRQPATLHAEHRTALPEWLGVVTGEASQCSRPSDPTGKRAGNRKRDDPQRRTAARLVMGYIGYRNWNIRNDRYNHGQVSSRRSRSLLPGARSPGDDRWRKAQAIGLRRQDAVAGSRGVFLLRSRGIADALGRRFTGRTGGVPRGQFRFSHYPVEPALAASRRRDDRWRQSSGLGVSIARREGAHGSRSGVQREDVG